MEYLDPKIIELALAAGVLVKGLVDLVKMAAAVDQWVPPALAIVSGPAFTALLLMLNNPKWDQATVALCLLAGLLAAFVAVSSTELQKRALPGK